MKQFAIVLACLTLGAPAARAGIIQDAEPNNTFATAQDVTPYFSIHYNPDVVISVPGGYQNTSLTTPHVTILRPGGSQTTDNLDYFKFTTLGTGPIVADITSAPVQTNFDTVLFLFDSNGNLIATNDDKGNLTAWIPGDNNSLVPPFLESRIETVPLSPGTYYVAVASSPAFAGPGGQIFGTPYGGGTIPPFGSYTLNISAPVPEPATLLGLGLLIPVAAVYARRRAAKNANPAENPLMT
ncbi:hypothetical protein FRUB_09428 [Fimbriiglobus ruber]|uniref:PEP-CTERM protein-sorting domain-containing protein n=2 Tax=Fimbriiglobus ruber TaxID=1908690 RepID=A0A225DGP1_9BACT|nr:hypothetical protein FRUB_09428 [Fimbriiglobus ruber]